MNGDQVLAKLLKAEGVEWISCFPAQTLIDACSRGQSIVEKFGTDLM